MKVTKTTLHIAGVVAGFGLAASIYIVISHKQKELIAAALIRELSKLLNPAMIGIGSEEAFDIHYSDEISKKIKGVLLMKPDTAQRHAQDIHNAWGWITDDEDKIYAVFRALKDKVQVSQVAKAYHDYFKTNLIDKLRDKLSAEEISEVLKIVNSLPRYRTVG